MCKGCCNLFARWGPHYDKHFWNLWMSVGPVLLQQCCSAAVLQCLGILQILQGRVNVLCMTGDRHVSRAEGAAGTPPGAADTRLMPSCELSSLFVCLFVLMALAQHQAMNRLGLGSYSYQQSLWGKWVEIRAHLSPGVSLISDLAQDSGILQSELFTSRSQNLVLAKLPSSGFWRNGQFFKWNREKMAKNDLKMVEIFSGASHMINNNI